jgi:hypothetical protein
MKPGSGGIRRPCVCGTVDAAGNLRLDPDRKGHAAAYGLEQTDTRLDVSRLLLSRQREHPVDATMSGIP